MTTYKYASVRGRKIFYREAGNKDAPTLVLLHGFPSSSHMFRDLIPKLSDRLHVIAPDYIGFGYSDAPNTNDFRYTFDQFFLDRTGNDAVQLDLLYNYQSNVALYDGWHEYFRTKQPRMLIVWGTNDPFFTVEGAKAYQRDIPRAELHLIDTGHFALEDSSEFIAERIREFLG